MILKIRRLIATYIDYVIVFYTCYYLLKIIDPIIVRNIVFEVFSGILSILLFLNLFLRKDIIFGYESIGKKIMRLKIYYENGEKIKNKKILVDRVFKSLSTFHLYMFMILINNKSNGDKKIGTTVK